MTPLSPGDPATSHAPRARSRARSSDEGALEFKCTVSQASVCAQSSTATDGGAGDDVGRAATSLPGVTMLRPTLVQFEPYFEVHVADGGAEAMVQGIRVHDVLRAASLVGPGRDSTGAAGVDSGHAGLVDGPSTRIPAAAAMDHLEEHDGDPRSTHMPSSSAGAGVRLRVEVFSRHSALGAPEGRTLTAVVSLPDKPGTAAVNVVSCGELIVEDSVTATVHDSESAGWSLYIHAPRLAVGRAVRVTLHGAVGSLQLQRLEVLAAEVTGPTLQQTWRNVLGCFATRPMLAEWTRHEDDARGGAHVPAPLKWWTYGEVGARAAALSAGLRCRVLSRVGAGNSAPGHSSSTSAGAADGAASSAGRLQPFVCIVGPNGVDWVVADLALAFAGFASVPVAPSLAAATLAHVFDTTTAGVVITHARCSDAVAGALDTDETLLGLRAGEPDITTATGGIIESTQALAPEAAHRAGAAGDARGPTSESRTLPLVIVHGGEPSPTLTRTCAERGITLTTMANVEAEGAVCVASGSSPLPPAVVDPSDTATVLFTSGSAGPPKGASRTFAQMNALLRGSPMPQPAVYVSFAPLSHMTERLMVPAVLLSGGQVAFCDGPDAFDAIADVNPSIINTVPLFFDALHDQYQAALARERALGPAAEAALDAKNSDREVEDRVMDRFAAGALGSRLVALSVGGAPTAPHVMDWIRRCFGTRGVVVTEGYGTTETGVIYANNRVVPGVDARLVDVPEMGYLSTDKPWPRGEIVVRTPTMISGYVRRRGGDGDGVGGENRLLVDEEGYYHTGDLGCLETPAGGSEPLLRVVGRLGSATKLSLGEFVSPEGVEAAAATLRIVHQVHVHASAERSHVVALVVPSRPGLCEFLRAASNARSRALVAASGSSFACPWPDVCATPHVAQLVALEVHAACRKQGLPGYQAPWAVHLVPEPFTAANGLLTGNGKPNRCAVETRYAAELEALYRPDSTSASDAVLDAVRGALGRPVDPNDDLATVIGVDSFTTIRVTARVSAALGVDVPLSAWLRARTLAQFVDNVGAFARDDVRCAAVVGGGVDHGSSPRRGDSAPMGSPARGAMVREAPAAMISLPEHVARDLASPLVPLSRTSTATAHAHPAADSDDATGNSSEPRMRVVLTGATGFVGVHLLHELLRLPIVPGVDLEGPVHVTCLVRAGAANDNVGAAGASAACRLSSSGSDEHDPADGMAAVRLRRAYTAAGYEWTEDCRKRVAVLAGDLGEPRLGLSEAVFAALARQTDVVVHSGACVNWVLSYSQLRAANVVGTVEMLRLASVASSGPSGIPAAFVHVSTLGVAADGGDEATMLSAEDAVDAGGYVLSKWVSEKIVRRAHDEGVVRVSNIVRPGMVGAHSASGHCNPSDFVSRYLRAVVQTGVHLGSSGHGFGPTAVLEMSPVDWVARATAAVVVTSGARRKRLRGTAEAPAIDSQTEAWHLSAAHKSLTYRAVGDAIRRARYRTVPVHYDEFRAKAVLGGRDSSGASGGGAASGTALTPLAGVFPAGRFVMAMGGHATWATERRLGDIAPAVGRSRRMLAPPHITEAYVHTWLRAMVTTSDLPAPRQRAHEVSGGVHGSRDATTAVADDSERLPDFSAWLVAREPEPTAISLPSLDALFDEWQHAVLDRADAGANSIRAAAARADGADGLGIADALAAQQAIAAARSRVLAGLNELMQARVNASVAASAKSRAARVAAALLSAGEAEA